jgi:hypothetical protein
VEGREFAEGDETLAVTFEALANPLRLSLLRRLARPAFMVDVTKDLDLTRQALKRHLEVLESAGLVEARPTRRGALPATAYVASPTGLFAFKETVAGLALPVDPALLGAFPTRDTPGAARPPARTGPGLLLVHGDVPGRWFPLDGGSHIVGRDPRGGIGLPYDPFASTRHAHVLREGAAWRVTDLHSRNGTLLNFERLAPGETRDLRTGDVLTIGRSRLVFRDGA